MLSPPLNKEETKYVQAVAGTLLYYARAVDSTILPALSSLATEQAKPTQKMVEQVKQLFDYCATQEEAIITYSASKNESMHPQQHGTLQQKERMKPSRRTFFPVEQQSIPS